MSHEPLLIFWVDQYWPSTGGLQKRVLAMVSSLESVARVVVVTGAGERPPGCQHDVVVVSSFEAASRVVEELLRGARGRSFLYVARLLPSVEMLHAKFLRSIAQSVDALVVRAQSTLAAEILSRSAFVAQLSGSVSFFHALNPESFRSLSTAYGGGAVRHRPNPFPDIRIAKGTPQKTVLFASRIVESKGLHLLIRAWMRQKNPAHTLVIRGEVYDPQYHAYCRALSSDAVNVSWGVQFDLGDTSQIAKSAFTVLPSLREGHSNLVCEAMMTGSVVAGSDVPGIREHIAAGRGLVFDRTVTGIADAIGRVVSMSEIERISMQRAAWLYGAERLEDTQLRDIKDAMFSAFAKAADDRSPLSEETVATLQVRSGNRGHLAGGSGGEVR